MMINLGIALYILGFLCPVHTPDGTPCGLMNHLSATCQVKIILYHFYQQICKNDNA